MNIINLINQVLNLINKEALFLLIIFIIIFLISFFIYIIIHEKKQSKNLLLRQIQRLRHAVSTGSTAPPRYPLNIKKDSIKDLENALNDEFNLLIKQINRLDAVLSSMGEALIVLDSEQCVQFANHAAKKLFKPKDIKQNMKVEDLIYNQDVLNMINLHQESHKMQHNIGIRYLEIPSFSNPDLPLLAQLTPVTNSRGCIIIFHDLSALNRLENMRRDFVANVSHELKTPLGIIIANTELLLDGALEDKLDAYKFSEAILRQASRLDHLIQDILDLSTYESHQTEMLFELIHIKTALEDSFETLTYLAQKKEQILEVIIKDESLIYINQKAFSRIILNLVGNAIKYSPSKSTITLIVQKDENKEDYIKILILDEGPGIETKSQHRIFERFYRVDQGRSSLNAGFGLGLTMVKNLSEAMRGNVGYLDRVPKGSIFWVNFSTQPF